MTKPISTRTHGIIDYTWAAAASSAAARVDGNTARLLRTAATAATASSLLTRYECGLVPLVPMKGHLAADAVLCSALVAAPLFLPRSERRFAAIPVLLGIAGIVTGLLTKTRSPLEEREELEGQEEFGGLYGGTHRSAVADPDSDLAAAPYLRPHLE